MTEAPITVEVNEKDKPFFLALIGSGITILSGILASVKVAFIDPVQSMDIFKATLTLTAMAWAYYFAKKE
jgi:hypothetical protein